MPHLQALHWDYQDQLTVVELNGTRDTAYYNYDGSGQRLRKVVVKSGKRTERLYLGGVERYREYSGTTLKLERWTVQIDDIAQVDTLTFDTNPVVSPVPLIRYQYRDHLGSAALETNELGQVISYEEYHPFGTSAYRVAKSGTDLSLKRYRFTNKERDDETGLYYFGVRYYAAWLGRWTSSDPGGFIDGLNMYVYVRNNPVNGVDLEGYSTESVEPGLPPPMHKVQSQSEEEGLPTDDTFKSKDQEIILSNTYPLLTKSRITKENGISVTRSYVRANSYPKPEGDFGQSKRGDYIGTLDKAGYRQRLKDNWNWDDKQAKAGRIKWMGKTFEEGVLQALGLGPNIRRVGYRKYGYSIPDMMESTKLDVYFVNTKKYDKTKWFGHGYINEVKMKDYVDYSEFQRGNYRHQFEDYITYLANNDDHSQETYGYGDFFWRSINETAAENGVAILHIVTPVGGWIDKQIYDEATENGIQLLHSEVWLNEDDLTVRVSDPVLLNGKDLSNKSHRYIDKIISDNLGSIGKTNWPVSRNKMTNITEP